MAGRRRAKKPLLTRSETMARVRSEDTAPELAVRRALWAAGLHYRLHVKEITGTPDIVFQSRRVAVFVHGCFWHGHEGCPRHRVPKTNRDYWEAKIARNQRRDAVVRSTLEGAGWAVMVVWECEISNAIRLKELIKSIARRPPSRRAGSLVAGAT